MPVKTKQKAKTQNINPEFAEVSQQCLIEGKEAFLRRPDGSLATVLIDEVMFHERGLVAIVRGTTQQTKDIWRAYPVSRLLPKEKKAETPNPSGITPDPITVNDYALNCKDGKFYTVLEMTENTAVIQDWGGENDSFEVSIKHLRKDTPGHKREGNPHTLKPSGKYGKPRPDQTIDEGEEEEKGKENQHFKQVHGGCRYGVKCLEISSGKVLTIDEVRDFPDLISVFDGTSRRIVSFNEIKLNN